jgi:hypothetical protein
VVGPILFAVELIATLNVLSGGVAVLISYYAYRFNRLVNSRILASISVGFALLGFALLAESATTAALHLTPVEIALARGLQGLLILLYILLQPVAYAFFAVGYARAVFGRAPGAKRAIPILALTLREVSVVIVLLYLVFLFSQVAIVLLLSFVVVAGAMVYVHTRSRSSLMVMLGFLLIFFARLSILGAVISPSVQLYVWGTLIEFAGFVFLLLFLVRSGRVGPT